MRRSLLTASILICWSPAVLGEMPPSFRPAVVDRVDRADIVVKTVRLTDNGDNDGFADPNEMVSLYVTLWNSSGADRDGIVVTVVSVDPTVDCIPSPVVSFGSLLAGQERESAIPAVFRVANVARSDPFASLTATFDLQISGSDFGGTVRAQRVVLDLDLNVSGGLLPTTYTEGFEASSFGSFTTMTLDTDIASPPLSDGFRCQYNDPDFANSNSYGNTHCFLGFPNGPDNAYDWHVHTTASPDGGRAYLGSQSLHWGVHPGPASGDTTRLKQLDAVRTLNTVNLGWNGVSSVLSFKHQIGLVDSDYIGAALDAVDRGIVQIQLANSSAVGVGNWRKIYPYQNVYDTMATDTFSNCMFDPSDDGNTEDDYFDPTYLYRRLGPSSTCGPEFVFSRVGATLWNASFDATDIHHASDGPGLPGSLGPGTWVQSQFDLSRYRGRRLRVRFLATSIEANDIVTMQQGFAWNSDPNRYAADDGWYIDDVRVTNTLTSAATVSVDQADRSGLPACGPVCGSLTASLTASPPTASPGVPVTLDASGSAADQCPGGALLYRFWVDSAKDHLMGVYDPVLQEWAPNAVVPSSDNATRHVYVDVRCSTGPAACNSRGFVVVPFVCPAADREPFPRTIGWVSKTEVSWGTSPGSSLAIFGDLDALHASHGQFDGTVLGCLLHDTTFFRFTHTATPDPGKAFYYLVKNDFDGCTVWSTGSPAEVPGAGGDRDLDLAYDPHVCPSYN